MPYAQFDQNGNICCVTSVEVTSPLPSGISQVQVPNGVDGISYTINTITFLPVLILPTPAPAPTVQDLQATATALQTQLTALQQAIAAASAG